VPVLAATGGLPPAFVRYGVSWEWNGPLYEPLWRLLDRAGAAPALARAVEAWEFRRREFEAWDWIYPYLYPQLLAKAALGLAALAAIGLSLREGIAATRRGSVGSGAAPGSAEGAHTKEQAGVQWSPVSATGRLFGRLLLCSATFYPWYALWALPWAALAGHRAWLALSGLALLSYLAPYAGVPVWPWIYAAVWGPFFLLLAAEARARRWSTA
jgi:hypothetical protein